ncbi:RfbX [Brachybacterium phenoliresistens]|uniref:RfbX n=1 Tax=Brachybacterium phenoliresistens TaxID=396014 RepID=Z9JRE2_9MICO|nr:oligosaccharide flippase family protein [Brachybacterium phenoliresistens]EWS80769.1 RfbX [Brachybacterium phenoliresistens]
MRAAIEKLTTKYPTLRNITVLFSGAAGAQAVVMAVSVFTARIFSPEVFGQFAIYGSLTAIAVTVASLRMDMTIMLPEDDDSARRIAKVATISNIVVGGLFSVVAVVGHEFITAYYGDEELASWLAMGGVTVFLVAQVSVLQYWFNRRSDYPTIALNRLQQQIGSAGGQLTLGALGLRSVAGLIFGTLAGQAFAFFNLRRKSKELLAPIPEGTPSAAELLSTYRRMPLLNLPTALVDSVRTNGITLLIGSVALGAVGQFNLAWRILQVPVSLINSAVSQVFFQKLARVKPGEMYPLVRITIIRGLLLSVVPFGLIYLLAPWMFTFVFGEQWDQAGGFARALTPWLMFQLASSPVSTVFVVTETQHWMLIFSIVFCAVPLSLLYFSPLPLLTTVYWLGGVMAAMLALMLVMSLFAARRYDRRSRTLGGSDAPVPDAG